MLSCDCILVFANDKDASVLKHWKGNMSELDALDELLYIWWELSPSTRDWKLELSRFGWTTFDYHGCELCMVYRVGTNMFRVHFFDYGKTIL